MSWVIAFVLATVVANLIMPSMRGGERKERNWIVHGLVFLVLYIFFRTVIAIVAAIM